MSDSGYRARNAGKITHSKLSDFIKCPLLYDLKWNRNAVPEPDSDALVMGTAFDLMMRDKGEFNKKYEILLKGRKRSDHSMWIQLTASQGDTLHKMEAEFRRQPLYNPRGEMQYRIEIEYNGEKIVGDMDEFDRENALILDDKTTASIPSLRQWLPKYKRQLAFYQWLVEMKEGIRCAGAIRAVSKEDIPKSAFYFATPESLSNMRDGILQALDALIEANRTGHYPYVTIPGTGEINREECLSCDAYGVCPHSLQTEPILL